MILYVIGILVVSFFVLCSIIIIIGSYEVNMIKKIPRENDGYIEIGDLLDNLGLKKDKEETPDEH